MVDGVYEVCAGIFNTHGVLRVYERVTPEGQLYNCLSFITTIFRWMWYTGYTHIVPGIIYMGINIGWTWYTRYTYISPGLIYFGSTSIW